MEKAGGRGKDTPTEASSDESAKASLKASDV